MKLFLIMTIVTLFLAGCGQSEHEHSHGHGDGEHHQDEDGGTPLFYASPPEISDLLRKHGGK